MIHMGTIYYILWYTWELFTIFYDGNYLLYFMYVYLHMGKNNKPIRSENLTSGQIFFKEGLIRLVRRNSYSEELFRYIINTIRVGEGTPLQFFVRTTNDVTTNHYFFRPHLFSYEQCFCVFKCIILFLLTLFF